MKAENGTFNHVTSPDILSSRAGAVVGLGNFDGLHLGHMSLIYSLLRVAQEKKTASLLYTFREHPSFVLNAQKVRLLTDNVQKLRIVENTGIDSVYFDEFDLAYSKMTPEEFIREILIGKLSVRYVIAGYDFRFGCGASGTSGDLKDLGKKFGLDVGVIDPYLVNGEVVSSTLIRKRIETGDVESASYLLGRLYSLRGEVVAGNKIGREIGIPTANIKPGANVVIPGKGVYITSVRAGDLLYRGLTNIGNSPTFGVTDAFTIETHILGFSGDLYGKEIEVFMHKKLRDEIAFLGREQLKSEILEDITKAVDFFQ